MIFKGHSPINLIIRKRKLIEKSFIVLLVISLLCVPFVGVNYDLTKYLPDDAPSAQALKIMEDEFSYPGMARVMLKDVTLYEAKAMKDRIAEIPGVDQIMWCDTSANIFGSSEFISYGDIEEYYKDDYAYMDLTFSSGDSTAATHKAIAQIVELVGDKGVVAGSAMSDYMLGPTINAEVSRVMMLAVLMVFLVLALTTTSWFEPLMFLMVMFVAILINNGTNIIFGEVSFLTNAVSSVLQLAVSMDYSIFLLHSFTREKANGIEPEQAMANALRASCSSILSSGMTTVVGFLALALMRFGVGRDMGLVLAKGVAISLLTVLLLMPSLILRFQRIVEKTGHRSVMPGFRGMGTLVHKLHLPVLILVIILVVPSFVGQSMSDFTYGNEAISSSPGTQVYKNEQEMNARFGKSNIMLALIPVGDNVTEKAMSEQLDDLPYTKYVISLSSVLPAGIPEGFLPNSLTGQMHSENWARMIINVRSSGESDAAFGYADEIRAIMARYYPSAQTYLVGTTPSTQDIRSIITADYSAVNLLSLIGVAIVVGITFKSFLLPLVVLIPIESAVFINTAIPYISGDRTMFLGFIIVSCVQLGATIDYSILQTNNYLDARAQADKKEAAIRSVASSALSILTSGTILTIVGYGLYFMTSVAAVGDLGHLIGRGAVLSMILVLFMLPACLLIFDRFIVKKDYAEKKHARLNRIRAMKLALPTFDALREQQRTLREQMRANRCARHQRIVARIHGKSVDKPIPKQLPRNPNTDIPPDCTTIPTKTQTSQEDQNDEK